ncbi:hypothetical protein N9L92_00160 [Saprospiraceae bacterium]|nr:hypothetical protein [Saprospiraceae bacterium]
MIKSLFTQLTILLILSVCAIDSGFAQPLNHTNNDLPCVNKNYNIAAHVAVDSANRRPLYTLPQIDTIMERLNVFFSPICVSFSTCDYNVLENDYSLGIIKNQPLTQEQQLLELKTRFSLRRRINIFFLDSMTVAFCGSSTFEGILTERDANIYVENQCADDIAGQIAHHLGHTFGLMNTYDPFSIEFADGSNCATTADRICDTPADPFLQFNATAEERELIEAGELEDRFFSGSCEFIYEVKDPNGEFYQPDMGNIMSGYPCKCGFTQDQFRLMVETILRSDIRHF